MNREERIQALGGEIFRLMETEQPSLFDRGHWSGKLMELAMGEPEVKVRLFRFIDVLPTLRDAGEISRHVREYFLEEDLPLPPTFRTLLEGAGSPLGGVVAAPLLKKNAATFARTFIAGENPEAALAVLLQIEAARRRWTVDILGEAVLAETEADTVANAYRELLRTLAHHANRHPLPAEAFPRINISVKVSALCSRIAPHNHDGSVAALAERLGPILREARETGGFVNLDMESRDLKEITLDLYRSMMSEPEFAGWEGAGIALQAYLKETPADIERLARWGKRQGRRIPVRLVKGAYWEHEIITARQRNWPVPVYSLKSQSDWGFEHCAELLLSRPERFLPAFGTHNVRSIAAVLAMAEERGIGRDGFEFQMLYGMAEPVKKGLGRLGFAVREYAPVGELLPGMAYLVRRLLENSSNEGFLRRTFVSGAARDQLLRPPEPWTGDPPPERTQAFGNEPPLDFSLRENRERFRQGVVTVRSRFGAYHPAMIGGKEITTGEEIVSVNPANPREVVASFAAAGPREAEQAVSVADAAQPAWERAGAEARAAVLCRAAQLFRARRVELSALQVLEVGKSWTEADADVAEAIDYLEYYAREAVRLGEPRRLGNAPGEENRYFYTARGVAAVIAPWNFPLAIPTGMVAAALAAGNSVVFKPSSLSPACGWEAYRLMREAGVPAGALSFLPGSGTAVGAALAEHPRVAIIAFTGSREVGLSLVERGARLSPSGRTVKRVIAEMGGKNAIIVDADADLDQAVDGVLRSAFGYQGQKCSACSRVIVLAGCYDRFLERLADAVKSIAVGPPEDPAFFMGPMIDDRAAEKVLQYREIAQGEGRIAAVGSAPEGFVPPVVVADLPGGSRVLREEIFGPLLAVIKAATLDDALAMVDDSDYALTGGIYSRSPSTIRKATEELKVGNLYINRPITGALVGRQPFGGFRLSGIGSKAGGPDYLLQFMEPRVVTENTQRRGFSPEVLS